MATSAELHRFIAACDPGAPAGRAYVQRQPPFINRLAATLQPSPTAKVLVVGQTGVGKSTELQKYNEAFQKEHYALCPPLDTGLDLEGTSWHEILLFTVAWSAGPHWQLEDELTNLLKLLEQNDPSSLCFKLRHQPELIRPKLAQNRTAIWDLCCGAIQGMQRARPVVLLWDGLEKLPAQEQGRRLFYTEGRFLRALPCRAVISGPLGLSFEPYFDDVQAHFDSVERLRAVPRDQRGFFFNQVFASRGLNFEIIHPFFALARGQAVGDLAQLVITAGGGLPRQTLQIISQAAKQALLSGIGGIVSEHIALAIRRVGERFRFQLGPEDLAALRKPVEQLAPVTKNRLLQLTALIESETLDDGRVHIELNPLVRELLDTQGAA